MLSCDNLSVHVKGRNQPILDKLSAQFAAKKLHAIVGPSGCGKTTLMRAMLQMQSAQGTVSLQGSPIVSQKDVIGAIGLVPQFSVAHEQLRVSECLSYTLRLHRDLSKEKRTQEAEHLLKIVGLSDQINNRVNELSGGQLRRLGLALGLAPRPEILLCDEVTSGLDPNSETEILQMLATLRDDEDTTFICIIHNLSQLHRFETITVLFDGHLAFQGTYPELLKTFEISDPLELYDALSERDPQPAYHKTEPLPEQTPGRPKKSIQPNPISQTVTLLERRIKLFFRNQGALLLTAAITFGFPLLVIIFASGGLPPVPSLSGFDEDGAIGVDALMARAQYGIDVTRVGSLVMGLVLFEVVLLTLMTSNNGAREIAEERPIFRLERLRGLAIISYVSSKALFVGLLSALQGAWMAVFVDSFVSFPGSLLTQILLFAVSGIAMAWVALGFSAVMNSAERASLASVYLVGFQLPLAGIVLKLPDWLEWICRPFINAYWAWSGMVRTMLDSRYYDAVVQAYEGITIGIAGCVLVLMAQGAIGLFLVYRGSSTIR
ncbi:MAG: ABC transporter ATP-binding protein/permease [Verrucomicrobiota bacterium]